MLQIIRYLYAEAITGTDTTANPSDGDAIGKWDEANNRPFGFVDVPFHGLGCG